MDYSLFLLGIVIVFPNSPLGIFGSPFPEPNASNVSNGSFSSAVNGDADGHGKIMGPVKAKNSSSSVALMPPELTNAPKIIGEQVAKPNQAKTNATLLQSFPVENPNPDEIDQLREKKKIKSDDNEVAKQQQKNAPKCRLLP